MKYQNPIILSDFSDPDCIRYKDSYYLISSSFNQTPIIPILKSKNLVDWKFLRYVSTNQRLANSKFIRYLHRNRLFNIIRIMVFWLKHTHL